MANVIPVLNEHIRRIARRELWKQLSVQRRQAGLLRREIHALKQLVQRLARGIRMLERQHPSSAMAAPMELPENVRFRADGLRSHRARLGLSAREYGRLVGVSTLTIYNWESGKARPRKRQLAALVEVRSLGKRELMRRLASLDSRAG
jgi:DNA-binding transcriptional regulator YiaG